MSSAVAPAKAADAADAAGPPPRVLSPNPIPKIRSFKQLFQAYWQNQFAQEFTFYLIFTVIFSVGAPRLRSPR